MRDITIIRNSPDGLQRQCWRFVPITDPVGHEGLILLVLAVYEKQFRPSRHQRYRKVDAELYLQSFLRGPRYCGYRRPEDVPLPDAVRAAARAAYQSRIHVVRDFTPDRLIR